MIAEQWQNTEIQLRTRNCGPGAARFVRQRVIYLGVVGRPRCCIAQQGFGLVSNICGTELRSISWSIRDCLSALRVDKVISYAGCREIRYLACLAVEEIQGN